MLKRMVVDYKISAVNLICNNPYIRLKVRVKRVKVTSINAFLLDRLYASALQRFFVHRTKSHGRP